MYSRSAKGGEKGDPNRNPWLAKMELEAQTLVKKLLLPDQAQLFFGIIFVIFSLRNNKSELGT